MKFEYVDLGLSVNWATCNLGAPCPEDGGVYLPWGEIYASKQHYYYDSYKWCDGSNEEITKYNTDKCYGLNGYTDNLAVLELVDDAARVHWGFPWRMPTVEEFVELEKNCDFKDKYVNGKKVVKVQSKINGNSIILPEVGHFVKGNYWDETYYWSSSLMKEGRQDGGCACAFQIGYLSSRLYSNVCFCERYSGFQIRPVRPKTYKAPAVLRTNALCGTSVPTLGTPIGLPQLKDNINNYSRTCRVACLTEQAGLSISLGQWIDTENIVDTEREEFFDALLEYRAKGHRINSVTMTDNGSWFFTCGRCYKGRAPKLLLDKMRQWYEKQQFFRSVSISENDDFVILTDKYYFASLRSHEAAIQKALKKYGAAKYISITNRGLCVICEFGVYYENIPVNLEQKLKTLKFVPDCITFTDSGKYIISYDDGDYFYNL